MNGRFLLDTNIVIALFAADEAVIANIAAAEEVLSHYMIFQAETAFSA